MEWSVLRAELVAMQGRACLPYGLLGSEGRASAYLAEGRRFESRRSPLFLLFRLFRQARVWLL